LARGAPETATAYGRRALAEPPPATERPRVLLALGTAVGLSADPADAPAHLREALRGLRDRAERLQAAVTLAAIRVHAGDSTESVEVLAGLLDEVAGYDDVLAAEIEAHLVSVARFHAGARRAAQPVAARVRARVEDDRNALPAVLVCDAVEHVMADGPAATVIALCERAFADPDEPMRFARNHTLVMAARALTAADALDLAARVLEQEMAEARGRGAAFEHAFASVFRADVHLHAGEIFAGEAGMRTAYAFTSEQPWPVGLQAITANLTWALLERGELDEAVGLLAETALDGPAAGLPDTYTSAMLLHTRGRLGLARGLAEAAAIDLRECGRRLDDHAETNPALIPWRSGLARALHALGDVEGARALAADELARARGFAARGALGLTLRAVAHVGPPEDAVGTLHEAVDVLAGSPRRLEHGHALADLGVALLAQGRQADARTALRGALELAHLCGGAALEQRALARLREAGSRPRRALLRGPGALTPRERQVVELAAAGTPNREIADTLFVTVRTVEFHLARAYRKLEVAGRTELAEALTPRA
ncbi:MAG: transcriptional regulator, LuxR family, partial [Conexibacter sp.]|nr:transcriptional regulator, LuxR family [Conexibacter sp.]